MSVLENPLSLRDMYPATPGATTPELGGSTASATSVQGQADSQSSPVASNAIAVGMQGSAVHFWIALAVLLFLGMWLAERYASGGAAFANIKFSLYNVLAIVILGIVGGSIAKVIMTKWPIPGVSTIILAS